MLAGAHQQAAEDIEKTILPLQAASYAARVVIEGAWGAAFHWTPLAAKLSIRTTRRAMLALGPSFAAREREQSPSGGRT